MSSQFETVNHIRAIWAEITGVQKIDLEANYLTLGLHSVFIVQIIHRLNKDYSVTISAKEFMKNQSINKLAALVSKKQKDSL
jgi:acyl carrier protein